MIELNIELPWPPTANTYWRRNGSRYFISSKGQTYRTNTAWLCLKYRGIFKAIDRIRLSVEAYPPDKRNRDLDNLCKSIQDSLQYANVYVDDSQIDELYLRRMPEHLGKVILKLEKI